jgi:hypothetical protein
MTRGAWPLAAAFLLASCASQPVADWQADATASLDAYRRHYLDGNTRLAQRDYAQARAAFASTGSLERAARAEMIRCAVAVAALDFDACAGVDAVLGEASSEDRSYGLFLLGRWDGLDTRALSANYRAVAGGRGEAEQNEAAARIDDSLSRLIAAGVLLKLERSSPATVNMAVNTASSEGYRRPLLAWLMVQAKLAEAAGDKVLLETARKRIEFVTRNSPRGVQP